MQLLLFLSALLAGLTGAITGDRYARPVQQQGNAAIARAAESVAQAVIAVSPVQLRAATPLALPRTLATFARHAAPPLRPARLTSERRLE